MLNKIREVLLDNTDAVTYFLALRSVLHLWDDLIDKDRAVPEQEVNEAMWNALVAIPGNPFFLRHAHTLGALTANAVANWQAANQFEGGDDERRLQLAFVIRSDYANILIHCAYLVGGRDWMLKVTPMIRDLWTDEDFTAYCANLRQERRLRGAPEHLAEVS